MRSIFAFILGALFMVVATGNIMDLIDIQIKKFNGSEHKSTYECFVRVALSLTLGAILLSMAVKFLPP